MQIQEVYGPFKQLISVPARYDDEEYRLYIYHLWMQDVIAAREALADINNSPYYNSPLCGHGWRVD
jgi:hypothetical protein